MTRVDGMGWESLEHQGPPFPSPYKPLPHGTGVLFQGRSCQLSPAAEEAARLWVGSGLQDNPEATVNFAKHFNEISGSCHAFEDLDFSNLPPLKASDEPTEGHCRVNGINTTYDCPNFLPAVDKEGNFYPRVLPEDVEINVSESVKLISNSWRQVWHLPEEDWLARWGRGFIEIPRSGPLLTFDKVRSLKGVIPQLRRDYRVALDSHLWQERQWATTLYFVDALTLPTALPSRAGRNDGLRCGEVRLLEPNVVETPSGQYRVHRRVFLNVALLQRQFSADESLLMSYSYLNMLLKLEYGDACTHLAIVRYNATALCVSRLEALTTTSDLELRRVFAAIWQMLHEPRQLSSESTTRIEYLRAQIFRRKRQMWDKHRPQCRKRLPRVFFRGITGFDKERYLSKLEKGASRVRRSPAESREAWERELDNSEWKRPKAFPKLLQEIESMQREIVIEHLRAIWVPNHVDPRVVVAFANKNGIEPAGLFGGMHRRKTFEWALGTPAKWKW